MPEWLTPILTFAGVLVALAAAYLGYLATRRTTDQARITRLEQRLDALEKKVGMRDDYVNVLRDHINTSKPPPAPAYPSNYWE